MTAPDLEIVATDPDGRPRMGRLRRDARVDGIPCLGGPMLHWHANGVLAQCVLAEPHVAAGHLWSPQTILAFDDHGHLETATVLATTRVGDVDVVVPDGAHGVVELDADGRLVRWSAAGVTRDAQGRVLARRLERDEVIDQVPCAASSDASFDADGRLASATLGSEHSFGDLVLAAGTRVTVTPDGRLRSAMLAASMRIGDRDYPAGAVVTLDEAAQVERWATIEVSAPDD